MSDRVTKRQPHVYAIATMDTKGQELQYVAKTLREAGIATKTVDVGTHGAPEIKPDVSREEVLQSAGLATDQLGKDRGTAVSIMGDSLRQFLLQEVSRGNVAGVIGIGGSGGTALITNAMRALGIGLPKVMVSTVASGNTAPYVESSDILMMYSVVDIAGLNRVSKNVLANASHAMAGMVAHASALEEGGKTLGMTMFGVTTPCVNQVRGILEPNGYECLVFHATGTGGRTMEHLVASGLITGVLDLTTTEVADQIVGGVFACGEHRFDTIVQREIPLVLSLGALDMVNFGAMETVPERFKHRNLHVHNANVTLMRTTVEENIQAAQWIAKKLNRATGSWTVIIPEGGVSALDHPDAPFYDPKADAALFETLRNELREQADRQVITVPHHINDPQFARVAVENFLSICKLEG